jgi:phospho-N-acetylmuramoyl-pentapeptide-transferase
VVDVQQSKKPAIPQGSASRHALWTGTNLLIFLTLSLGAFAVIFESVTQRLTWGESILTLPLALSAIACGGLGFVVVPLLQKLKTGQIIQEDGPQTHLKKAGTPTMGGVFFIPIAVFMAVVWSQWNSQVLAASALTLAYFAVGWLDDWQVLRRKSNKGISPSMKLMLQILGGSAFCIWAFWTQPSSITTIDLPGGVFVPLGLLFWLLAGFILVAESNSTNITDGVDGLAGGTSAIALVGLGAAIAPNYPELTVFCACLAGGCLGFVLHNRNPAKVFMGDTGSLALGGALAAVGILSQNIWALFLVSGIFFIESLSVIAQVSYYKATKGPDGKGKRLLKMAPIHHHIELSGWSETQIVGAFYAIALGLALLALQ